jgi:hypothetical protein
MRVKAFPSGRADETRGMDLRDYFAIHTDLDGFEFADADAAASFLGEDQKADRTFEEIIALSARAVAKVRYIYADAMLAARGE